MFPNQIYLYGLQDTFHIDTDHKPLVPQFVTHKTMAPLRIEKIKNGVCLEGFNYRLNYVAGMKAGTDANEADYNCRHTGPSVAQENFADNQAEWTASDAEEVFEKDVRAVIQASLPDAVSWEKLFEQIGFSQEKHEKLWDHSLTQSSQS